MVSHRHVTEAIERVAEIHGHLARGEVYRGFRPLSTALTGVVGVAAALLQPLAVPAGDLEAFLFYWVGIAAANALLHGAVILRHFAADGEFARRRTLRVLGQFTPALAAGAVLTGAVFLAAPSLVPLLPGVWSLLFAVALFSSRPYLPRRIGWVALFYFAAGALLLLPGEKTTFLLGWTMGTTFGVGQLGAAAVLRRDEARHG